jgi:superfamily I DNA/RNA helicase
MSRIANIEIDDSNLPAPTPEIEQERNCAYVAVTRAKNELVYLDSKQIQ